LTFLSQLKSYVDNPNTNDTRCYYSLELLSQSDKKCPITSLDAIAVSATLTLTDDLPFFTLSRDFCQYLQFHFRGSVEEIKRLFMNRSMTQTITDAERGSRHKDAALPGAE
jgi:hypothetical protein